MRLRREIIWHSFLYSIYVSHVEILVRVGKLVWLRLSKVGGLFLVLFEPVSSTAIAGAVWSDFLITKCY